MESRFKYILFLRRKTICLEHIISETEQFFDEIEEDRTEEDKQSVQDEWVDYEAGRYIWSDGSNTYYSNGSDQYILDASTGTWNIMAWYVATTISDGTDIWSDGNNTYYSSDSNSYVLNTSTSTWSTKTWTNTPSSLHGKYIWVKSGRPNYCRGSTQYYLYNVRWYTHDSWIDDDIYGNCIWTSVSGEHYYSKGSSHYILDGTDWSYKSWNRSFDGCDVWTDGSYTYLSYINSSSNYVHYVLNDAGTSWYTKTWTGLTDFQGRNVWTDGSNTYYSKGTQHYILDKETSTWTQKVWTGLTSGIDGQYIWTDGNRTYYSYQGNQYVLNKH